MKRPRGKLDEFRKKAKERKVLRASGFFSSERKSVKLSRHLRSQLVVYRARKSKHLLTNV